MKQLFTPQRIVIRRCGLDDVDSTNNQASSDIQGNDIDNLPPQQLLVSQPGQIAGMANTNVIAATAKTENERDQNHEPDASNNDPNVSNDEPDAMDIDQEIDEEETPEAKRPATEFRDVRIRLDRLSEHTKVVYENLINKFSDSAKGYLRVWHECVAECKG